jgi:hypothetical protein
MRKVTVAVWFVLILVGAAFAQTPDPSKWMCRNLADSGGFAYEGETVFGNQACRPIPQSARATPTASKQDAATPVPANNTASLPKQEGATVTDSATAATPQPSSGPIATPSVSGQHFNFERGQRVYVVAVSTRSRDLDLTKSELEVERYAKDEFKKSKGFTVASTLRSADFVFFILFDSTSNGPEELALAALPDDYEKYGSNLDALRNLALWQSSGHVNELAHGELAVLTMGGSMLFDHPNLAKSLVKRFQKETISK